MKAILKIKDREIPCEFDGDEIETDDPVDDSSRQYYVEEDDDTFYGTNVEGLIRKYKEITFKIR